MKEKNNRLETLKLLISSQEIGCQEDLLKALSQEGFNITQATLSRDLKQLKVAKAASINGRYTYVLPNETMYKRIPTPRMAREMMKVSGFQSIAFSGNMGVMKTRPTTSTMAELQRYWAPYLETTLSLLPLKSPSTQTR